MIRQRESPEEKEMETEGGVKYLYERGKGWRGGVTIESGSSSGEKKFDGGGKAIDAAASGERE